MAQADETETRRKKGKGTSLIVWVLMAMLVLGLGSFGVTNFGGGLTAIGRVGEREITVNDYTRALQQELAALGAQFGQPISLSQATALGLDRQVRQQLVNTAALDNEAARLGLSVGDRRVAEEITATPGFQGVSGAFDRETYRFALEQNNLTEAEYEARLRDDIARALLQGAVAGGFVAPATLTDTLFAYVAERRGFAALRLTEADLTAPLPEPTDADLAAHHEANIARFTRPEARRITYAALLPGEIAADMAVDEATLRRLYDERIAEFVKPERRLVERLVYPDEAAAAAAKARLDAGEAFETLVAERGLTLADIDMGDVGQADLGPAGDGVFALTEPGVVGPLPSDLGPALFRMNGILAAEEITFDQARGDLGTELQLDAARRSIADRIEDLDDRLAGGATLEDLAQEAGLTLATFDYVPGSEEPIAGYTAFQQAAAAAQEGDFPEITILDDGGIVALRLDAIVPPTPIPLEDVRDDVAASWRAEALQKALADRAVAIKAEVEGGATLGGFGVLDVTLDIARDGFIEGAPPALLTEVFTMEEGHVRVIEADGYVAVARLDTITPAAPEGEEAAALKGAIAAQAEQALAQDAFTLYVNALTRDAGITLDEAAIAAVHAQFN
ncbi:MAG TPA: SurA N-terminal domain-containing protein [Paracoccaceae bacterium]|nr:SurA N-terminal domain-containing protein [Paracoccaceae bacterium]